MNEFLPKEYKEGFFYKLFKKFKNWFNHEKIEENQEVYTKGNVGKNNVIETRNTFDESIKVDLSPNTNIIDKERELNNLVDNDELLEKLSNDKLEKILQYYLNENNKKREKLKKLSV